VRFVAEKDSYFARAIFYMNEHSVCKEVDGEGLDGGLKDGGRAVLDTHISESRYGAPVKFQEVVHSN
jgi:hypothetical protein